MEIFAVTATAYRGILNQKTYVVTNENEAIIIDAGAELADVKKYVQDKKVLAILCTHLHFDHVWCIEDYLKEWNADVYVVEGAEEKFYNTDHNCSYLIRKSMVFNVDKKYIKYYENHLKIGDFDIDVFFTPGHSKDSVCLLIEKNLFCGDLVLGGSIGRTDLYDSDEGDMEDSLNKLEQIDFDYAYPGHYDIMSKKQAIRCF